jgi:hypothetical protein
MSSCHQIGHTWHSCIYIALREICLPGLADPMRRQRASFTRLAGKMGKQHSPKGNEQYLYVGRRYAFGEGIATVSDAYSALREPGGVPTCP